MTFMYVATFDELAGEIDVGNIVTQKLLGSRGSVLFSGFFSIALISGISAMFIAGPRVLEEMGKDYRFLKKFSNIGKGGTPVKAIVLQTIVSLLLILFVSFKDTANSNISIDSDLLTGSFKGNIAFSELGNSMKKFFRGYYNDTINSSLNRDNQKFDFELTLRNNPILSEILLPELQTFEGGYIKGEFNSNRDLFNVNLSVPNVNYSDVQVDSLSIMCAPIIDNWIMNSTYSEYPIKITY